jgi:arylsulfatase A-like enzyme
MKLQHWLSVCALIAGCGDNGGASPAPDGQPSAPEPHKVIIMVWDGLRPDSVTMADTPNLVQLGQRGVAFKDNHSTYPTFTMMNAASFATGARPGQTGFYGNTLWAPAATGKDSGGATVNFQNPVFTEDYAVLNDLDALYQNKLLLVGSLFEAAQAAQKVTAAVGKTGPAFLQDRHKGGFIIDENLAWPQALVDAIKAAGKPVPQRNPVAYGMALDTAAPNPTAPPGDRPVVILADGATTDPTNSTGSRHDLPNLYMMGVYLDQILGPKLPDLSLLWFRTPDSTEHNYGPGTPNYRDGLRAQDQMLGMLTAKLAALGMDSKVDIIVVSDHGHSSVSGPLNLFPLRGVTPGAPGAPNALGGKDPGGYSVSGDVRLADLLTRAGFKAFDGAGCTNDPVLAGIKADDGPVYAQQTDTTGAVCGAAGRKYVTPSYVVPATLPAKGIVVAANGGSDYLYLPDHDAQTVADAVKFLQSREEIGAIFVASRYGNLPGTLPLDGLDVEGTHGRAPDVILSYNHDEAAVVAGMPGIEFESALNNRGMHGSFSPIDVHNTLYAAGPDFKVGFADTLPSANVDVAPTVAKILGLPLPGAVGRALEEALVNGPAIDQFQVATPVVMPAAPATGLTMKLPTSPDGADVDAARTQYTIQLQKKLLTFGGKTYNYFDSAKAIRQ